MRNPHNRLDFACAEWRGDLKPARGDRRNRWFGGEAVDVQDRRCVLCRPFTDDEAAALIESQPLALEDVGS